jgi:phosphoadenosine phosphosulfate reductase
MLISSCRHKPEDLSLWSEYEQADAAYKLSSHKVSQSIDAIRQWRGDYAGTSWGKDSVTMMHLAYLAEWNGPFVYVRLEGRDNPCCEFVRDDFLETHPEVEYYERPFIYEQCSHGEHWNAVANEFGNRRMTGLRTSESTKRAISVWQHGLDTGNSFRPIAHWDEQDVFAFLCQNALAVNPVYAMLGKGRWRRDQIRTHSIGGSSGSGAGRREWEREYFRDVLRRIECS